MVWDKDELACLGVTEYSPSGTLLSSFHAAPLYFGTPNTGVCNTGTDAFRDAV